MASVIHEGNGRYRIEFGPRTKRRRIRLGEVSESVAKIVGERVERLYVLRKHAQPIDEGLLQWLANLAQVQKGELYDKFVLPELGVPPRRAQEGTTRLAGFLDECIAAKSDVKEITRVRLRQVRGELITHFGESREITTITPADADDFKRYMASRKPKVKGRGDRLAKGTVKKRIDDVWAFFERGVRKELIERNPFNDVREKAVVNNERIAYVKREWIDALMEVSDPTWRTIIALARYAGMRCPSEVLSLRWQDVNWQTQKITFRSPKTERHAGHESRTIPIFAALRPYLEEAYELAPEGSVYVVGTDQRKKAESSRSWQGCNLRTHFLRLIKRAGLKAWPRLFHNLRASCAIDLKDQQLAEHAVDDWMGHSTRVSRKHYMTRTDEHFQRAIGGAQSGARGVENEAPSGSRQVAQEDSHAARTASQVDSPSSVTARSDSHRPRTLSQPSGDDRNRTCTPCGTRS